jgi:tetratricopeptide (TPR) repeat protein
MAPGPFLLVAALFTPAPLAALGQGSDLSAAAAASGRPPECRSGGERARAKGPSIWELARVPTLQRYCDLLARAQAVLPATPDAARIAAEEAGKVLPGRAAPRVLLARALLALRRVGAAERAFDHARAIDPRSVEDPSTMHDLARVLVKTARREEALAVYRALVPRVDLLGTNDRRVSVLLEAAHLAMDPEVVMLGELAGKLQAGAKPAPPHRGLDEAIAYLREARQRPPTALAGDVLLSLALALDRSGARDEADATLAEARRAGAKPSRPPVEYLAADEDRRALDALASEGIDRTAAQKAWEEYLAGPGGKGPWASAARARLDLLRRGGGVRAPRAPPAGGRKPR